MMALESFQRRIRDAVSQDQEVSKRPEAIVRAISRVVEQLTPEERGKQVEHLRAYSEVYFQGKHQMATPREFTAELTALGKRVDQLNAVEKARGVLTQLGGPPTKQTLEAAVQRSIAERQLSAARNVPQKSTQKSIQKGYDGLGIS